jgi:serine phosphatase RsbU (regulator of sigma subunit)
MLGIARIDLESGMLACAGKGDVEASLYRRNSEPKHFAFSAPMNHLRKPAKRAFEEELQLRAGDLFIMHTDGLTSAATLEDAPQVLLQPAAAVAEHLMKNYWRQHDDALVLVLGVLSLGSSQAQ